MFTVDLAKLQSILPPAAWFDDSILNQGEIVQGPALAKKGSFEFVSQDSWYRLKDPICSSVTLNGVTYTLIQLYCDHIIGSKLDDHATVQMWVTSDGLLVQAQVTNLQMGGAAMPGSAVFALSSATLAAVGGLASITSAGAAGAILALASLVGGFIYQALQNDTDDGGRSNFPNIIEHLIARTMQCLVAPAS
jgi:hypothetical protein